MTATTVTFQTTLPASGNNTGIVVPDDVIAKLGVGRRPAVHVTINGHEYRNTIAVMGGQCDQCQRSNPKRDRTPRRRSNPGITETCRWPPPSRRSSRLQRSARQTKNSADLLNLAL